MTGDHHRHGRASVEKLRDRIKNRRAFGLINAGTTRGKVDCAGLGNYIHAVLAFIGRQCA
jgi:hypothetical protein